MFRVSFRACKKENKLAVEAPLWLHRDPTCVGSVHHRIRAIMGAVGGLGRVGLGVGWWNVESHNNGWLTPNNNDRNAYFVNGGGG